MTDPTWGEVMLAGAAVFAAAVAAITAILRQRKQLDAESERLDKQLAHDGSMRELEETRTVLDDAMKAVSAVIEWTTAKSGNASLAAQLREMAPEPEILDGITFSDAKELVAESAALMTGLSAQAQRLRLRFGESHELHLGYLRLVGRVNKTIGLVGDQHLAGQPDDEAFKDASKEMGAEMKTFAATCLKYTGLTLKPAV